jgi:hypothetical protein
VERKELNELHYITPIANVASILRLGILSHKQAANVPHQSVAMAEIQNRRKRVIVPGARPLHDYVNLYICARNPMMYKRRESHGELCVLRVSTDVLDVPGVVVSDSNAGSDYVRFAPAPDGLKLVDKETTFAERWTDPDPIQKYRKAARKCAEVLVPDLVPPRFFMAAYVSCDQSLASFEALSGGLVAKVDGRMFFR